MGLSLCSQEHPWIGSRPEKPSLSETVAWGQIQGCQPRRYSSRSSRSHLASTRGGCAGPALSGVKARASEARLDGLPLQVLSLLETADVLRRTGVHEQVAAAAKNRKAACKEAAFVLIGL